ncbi:ABC transporter permease [Telluribacter humicola]|uniref:ABC transporter permease n=1 Tax=Telluribacter humicola TaxID=1720261 RepID=UPI001A963D65|nr:ABC transporter permease [Telluribacter humicola]
MLRNYLKIALRNLLRHKSFTFINIIGLSIGLACCLAIVIFILDEYQYDAFHTKAERIYRVVNISKSDGRQNQIASTPPAYAPALKASFPEVEESVRVFTMTYGSELLISYEDKKYLESDILLADPSFYEVFSFPLTQGNPATALTEPNTLVISESMARKYFGNQDPLNKVLSFAGELDMRVTGVMKDVPGHSHLKANAVGSFSTLKSIVDDPKRLENWTWQQFYTYIVLTENRDGKTLAPEVLSAKFPAFLTERAKSELDAKNLSFQMQLQPLKDIHLRSAEWEYDIARKGNINHIYAFTVIALFALLIACFNFMNLSTAKSMQRAKEVGLRKVIGANRMELVRQFLGESILLTLLALVVALGIVDVFLSLFNQWMNKSLAFGESLTPTFIVGLLAATLVVGFLAGLYPAFFLSGFLPVKVLKGDVGKGSKGGYSLRKTLVVLQFTVSTALIIGTGIVFSQLHYVQRKDLGFDREQAIVLPIRNTAMRNNYENIKQELLQNPAIKAATATYGIPGGMVAADGIRLAGQTGETPINMFLIDYDYIPTMGMQLVAGRNFSPQYGTDAGEGFILNETAVKALGWNTPAQAIGQEIFWPKWSAGTTPADSIKRGHVVGVVKDFNYKSLHQKIEPAVMHIYPEIYTSIVVRVRPENMAATLEFLENKWKGLAPDWPFEYNFIDEQYAELYQAEQVFAKLFGLFTALSILIASMGLFGLASFMVQQRFKEIGVRKVLGASITGIVTLLSKDFLKLVLIAILIATPIAWYAMTRWLEDFAYKIAMPWWVFAVAGLLVVLVALATVSFQSVKAALMNPVKSLRSE